MSPPETDFFALFGLAQQYPLDRAKLETCYQQMSFQTHPDLVADNPQDQEEALLNSALLNQAYQTLSNDTKRAQLLLKLLLGSRSLQTDQLPPGFLQEMFILQEQADELLATTSANDTTNNDANNDANKNTATAQTQQKLTAETQDNLNQLITQRPQLFKAAQACSPASLSTLQTLQNNLNCERYLNRLLASLKGENREI